MRVLQVISSHITGGGAAPALLLSRELAKRGHDVLFACIAGSWLQAQARGDGLRTVDLRHLRRKSRPHSVLPLAKELECVARSERIDVVHVHRTFEHAAATLARLRNSALFRTWHAGEKGSLGRVRPLLIRRWPGVIAGVSEEAVEELRRAVRRPERVVLIHGGVDEEKFRPGLDGAEARRHLGIDPEAKVVGMVSKFSRERRIDVFLETLRLLDGCVGLLVGDGTRALDPAKLGRELGIDERLRVVNGTPDFADTVACIDIGVVLRSGTDGSCRAAMELMSMAKPVVLARRGFMKELVQNEVNGRLVSGDDPSELASAVGEIASTEALAERMGAAARERILRHFTASAFAKRYETLYHSLVGKQGSVYHPWEAEMRRAPGLG